MTNRTRAPMALLVATILAACTGTPSLAPTHSAVPIASALVSAAPLASSPVDPSPTAVPVVASEPFTILPVDPPAGVDAAIVCSGDIGIADPVGVVERKAGVAGEQGDVELVDFADPAAPRTVCSFDAAIGLFRHRLLDARHLLVGMTSATESEVFAIVDLPDVRFRWFQLPAIPGGNTELIAVAPALDRIVWKAVTTSGDEIHVTTVAGDAVIATLPDRNEGRCGNRTDSNQGAYMAFGSRYLYVLNQPDAP